MINAEEMLRKVVAELTNEKEKIEQEKEALGKVEANDEIKARIERMNEQVDVYDSVIGMAKDLMEEVDDLDLFLEKLKQHLPVIVKIGEHYSETFSGILNTIYGFIQKLTAGDQDNLKALFKQRAENMKLYYDALKEAELPEEVVAQILIHKGVPYTLDGLIETLVDNININFNFDD